MMTRFDLEAIKESEKKISQKKLELEALRYKASGAGGIQYDRQNVQTSPQDYLALAIVDIIELEKQIREDEASIENLKGKAYSIVRKIEDADKRALLEWYYLNGMSMIDTAGKLNMSERAAYYLRDDAVDAFENIK